jgi:hypothetical protein
MQNRSAGLAIAGLAIVAAVVLFIVLSGGDDSDGGDDTTVAQTTTTETTDSGGDQTTTTTTKPKPDRPEVPTVVVKDGEPVGGVQQLEFAEGDEMRFVVESDIEDEVHMHGYDVTEVVAPGAPAKFNVEATIPGVFELELHHAVTQIAEIEVG